jgi:hypothetical protein
MQLITSHDWPFAQLDRTTIRFLKARRGPNHQVHYVTVQDTTGQPWHFTSFLMKKTDQWYVKTLDGHPESEFTEPLELHDRPWIRLETLFMLNDFYAVGEVFDKGYQIERVRLLEPGGLVLEDTVQHGMVLFYSEQLPTVPPIQLELYNNSGVLVSRQTETLHPFPSVTKETD